MTGSVERANMTHNWVNYMREIIENDIECIIYNAKEGNLEETKRQILVCIGKILAQEYDEKFKYYYRKRNCVFIFPEVVLEKRRAIRKFNSNKEKEKKREYINYCRIVLYSIVELIEISYYSGMNYKEFVREALEKKNISASEEQIEALVLSFKKYVSKMTEVNGTIWKDLEAYRRKHEWLKDKNKNGGEQYYPQFSFLNKTVMEFEFYTRKLNESSNFDKNFLKQFQAISHDIWESYGKGMVEEQEINGYSKLVKKHLEHLNATEFEYMLNVLKIRLKYISENASKETAFLEQWHVWRELSLTEVVLNEDFPYLGASYFRNMAQVLSSISLDERLKGNDILWKALIQLVDTINDHIREEMRIGRNRDGMWNFWRIYRNSINRRFSETACIEGLKKLTESLNQTDKEFSDFVEICLNALSIKHNERFSQNLEKTFVTIFKFLKDCKDKEDNRGYNIKEEVKWLLKELESYGWEIDSNLDRYECSYVNGLRYFTYCYKTRYARFISQLKEQVGDRDNVEKSLDITNFVQNYIDSIIKESNQHFGTINRKRTQDFSGELLPIIIECIYPTHQPAYGEDKLYSFKTRLLAVLDKYVSRVDLGLEIK